MSDREFDNYLSLLCSLLRLRGKQRQAIAEELRSHLEDRLEELLAQGVAREEAIQQALAEFGDAAGLAGQFVAISWNRKRRWLVRLMTFSAAATLLIAASLVIFWPGRNAAPGRAIVAAKQPPAGNADPFGAGPARPNENNADPFGPEGKGPNEGPRPSYERIEAELGKPTNVDFVEQPLKDVFLFLQVQHQIPIYIKTKKLEEASVPVDKPITMTMRGVALRTVLDLMLDELELTYLVRDVLIITTPADEEANLETRVYDCRDLLAMPAPPGADKLVPRAAGHALGGMFSVEDQPSKGGGAGGNPGATEVSGGQPGIGGGAAAPSASPADGRRVNGGMGGGMGGMGAAAHHAPQTELEKRTEDLIELITATVKPDSWDDVGGPGSISAYNGLFAVLQTGKAHQEVEHVLDMLRKAAGLEVVKGAKVVR